MARNNRNASQQQQPGPTGFGALKCPLCREEGTIYLSLEDLETFKCDNYDCAGNDNTFSKGDIRDLIDGWQKVLLWVEQKDLYTSNQHQATAVIKNGS